MVLRWREHPVDDAIEFYEPSVVGVAPKTRPHGPFALVGYNSINFSPRTSVTSVTRCSLRRGSGDLSFLREMPQCFYSRLLAFISGLFFGICYLGFPFPYPCSSALIRVQNVFLSSEKYDLTTWRAWFKG